MQENKIFLRYKRCILPSIPQIKREHWAQMLVLRHTTTTPSVAQASHVSSERYHKSQQHNISSRCAVISQVIIFKWRQSLLKQNSWSICRMHKKSSVICSPIPSYLTAVVPYQAMVGMCKLTIFIVMYWFPIVHEGRTLKLRDSFPCT